MTPIVELEGVSKAYGSYFALREVSFRVRRGEFVAIMGPSGCGKSTLLHLVGLLDAPTQGRLFLDGQDASRLSDAERTRLRRERVGLVFQAFHLLPRLSALENVGLPMAYRAVGKRGRESRGLELLEKVGLSGKESQPPIELSGGEKQRVAIARALANDPDILLADEPTGNLDSHSSREILGLLLETHRAGKTILLVTHDATVAERAERIVQLKDGRIL